jgi:hypothetical protein
MAFTAQQKQALATWLEANIHKAIHTRTHREGIKTTVQVVDPIDGSTHDKEVPVLDGEGKRTFNEVTLSVLDLDEVLLRVQAKANKNGFAPTLEAIEDLLFEHRATIKTWLPVGTTISQGHSPLDSESVLAEDPDA